jgi:adapter protein MecA 1/2
MKLEKISDKQIRCTLNKSDLLDRELRISELAYGTEKAKELFRDLMHQASYELGFEVEDIPLVIEAIPLSSDCLMLIVTKVDDPDELDTRFAKFSQTEEMLPLDFDDNEIDDEDEDSYDIEIESGISNSTLELVDSLFNSLGSNTKKAQSKETDEEANAQVVKLFSFKTLDDISFLGKILTPSYTGINTLYKNPSSNIYYLLMTKSEHTSEEFSNYVHIAAEHGKRERVTIVSTAYFDEHFDVIVKDNALYVLSLI